jgi:predicted ATPase
MRTLIIVSVLVSVFPAFAHSEEQVGRVDLEVTTNSIHFEKRKDGREWNQKNTGFGLEYVFPPGTLWGERH